MIQVCIVGVGLIGGSLGMALRRVRRGGKRVYRVTGLGRSAARLKKAQRLGALDAFSVRPAEAVKSADIVVLSVPVQNIVPLAKKILPHLSAGTVLTDVGSVKGKVTSGMRALLRGKPFSFVGGHPIAGSEKTGVENASASIFQKSKCVLTTDGATPRARKKVEALWTSVGARCLSLPAARHDASLALTSHLPHLLAFALFSTVNEASKKNSLLPKLAAGSFRDMTRVAGSDPDLWTGVVSQNRTELTKVKRAFARSLDYLVRASNPELRRSIGQLARAKRAWVPGAK